MIPSRRLLVAALLAAAALGCLDARTTTCDGYVCPIGNVCDDAHDGCVVPDQLSACAEAADRTPCSFPGAPEAFCDRGVCLVPVCGNDLEEGLEACDDGNTTGGDGCSATCDSTETCGNETIDRAQGEECDDGGYRSHDGCSSRCALELPIWSEVTRPNRGTEAHEIVYDAARARLVAFGGRSPVGEALATTSEFDGSSWVTVTPAGPSPPPRWGHVLVYDATRHVVVLFGGEDDAGPRADTWTYDGLRWTEVTAAPAPTARSGAAGSSQDVRGEVVIFGGRDLRGALAETWSFDGAWTRRDVTGPVARSGHAMAYDAARARVVLHGGTGTAALADTWEWDGVAWVDAAPPSPPAARGHLAYDAANARIVSFGGEATASDALWQYDGAAWTPVALPPGNVGPSARFGAPFAYDAGRAQLVQWGGGIGVRGTSYDDTWFLDADGWHAVPTFEGPPRRIFAGFAYDRWRQRFILHGGGQPPGGRLTDTWALAVTSWADLTDATQPPPADNPSALAFDDVRGRMIMVRRNGDALETWAWDGAHWAELAIASPTPPRRQHALAYDRARDRVVLFGGDTAAGGPGATPVPVGDTWELDGDAWIHVTPATSPSARYDAAMAYDPTRGVVVLFGGRGVGSVLGDTWTYDGATWTELAVTDPPAARGSATMTFHAARDRVVLFGGDDGTGGPGGTAFTDVVELDGTTWERVDVAMGPFPRKTGRIAYDPARKLIVLHGGDPRIDTWELAYRSTTPDEQCQGGDDDDGDGLVDCADPDCEDTPCGPGSMTCQAGACACAGPATEVSCHDGFDEDCDGRIDCEDADCACLEVTP